MQTTQVRQPVIVPALVGLVTLAIGVGLGFALPPLARVLRDWLESTPLPSFGLVEVLGWTGDALNRVDRTLFFRRFNEGAAVQYFYEPFLEAFDPDLRRQLGVWYTPPEIVRYMVERVDRTLRDELGVPHSPVRVLDLGRFVSFEDPDGIQFELWV